MPIVTHTVTRPDGSPAIDARVVVELVGENGARVAGRDLDTGAAIQGVHHPVVDETATWSIDELQATAKISPEGTEWRAIERVDDVSTPYYAEVPDGPGPYELEDILVDGPPGPIPSTALRAHIEDTN